MKATQVFKDKLKLTAVLTYSFTEDTDPDVRKSFESMIDDLAFSTDTPAPGTRFLSVEYLEDVRNVRADIKNWIKTNETNVGAGSTIAFYYTKPERGYVKARVYTFK